jgi:DUF971 family protein
VATDALPEGALEIAEVSEVGQYAIQVSWGDGHRTGIYSFPYLRQLSELDDTTEGALDNRTFSR